jgi:UDP-glucose 4-epimerase
VKHVKSYLFIDDCIDAHIKALKTTITGHKAYNIASPKGITVDEIAHNIVKSMGLKKVKFTYTGGERGWAGDVKKAVLVIIKAERELSWKPLTSIQDGIQKYIQWLKEKT